MSDPIFVPKPVYGWITGGLQTEAIPNQDRLWKTLAPCAYREQDGRVFASPIRFLFDKTSSPWWSWSLVPPSRGIGDRGATIHDLLCRCRELMGLTQLAVDYMFRTHLMDDGIGAGLATLKTFTVGVSGQLRPAKGDGFHRKAKYNGPVEWRGKEFPNLAEWVKEHYYPRGGGLRISAQREMGWAA